MLNFDTINYWSEIKLDIIKDYASAYSKILTGQKFIREHAYVDAFAGAGVHLSKETGKLIPGSPLNALEIDPPFKKLYLIDLDKERYQSLKQLTKDKTNVFLFEGDCNEILLKDVFPKISYKDFRRGLCLLDPYGLHLNWDVISKAGQMESLEIFLNFPVMDMNQNVLWHNPEKVEPSQSARMDAFWGSDSWKNVVYETEGNLFGWAEKVPDSNSAIVNAFKKRLKEVAGFSYVPEPIPMRNSKGATVYYLFFASQNPVGARIVEDILSKYRDRGKS
jgi:three-Cys-motif partner protein